MAKITSNEILREQSLEKLTEAYYEQYKYDNRLPDLFELIEPEKLYEWLVEQFDNDFSYKEIKELFDYQPDYLQIGEVEYINGIPHFLFDQSSEGLIFKDEEAYQENWDAPCYVPEYAAEDAEGGKFLVIHSGSRNLGVRVCQFYQKIAEELCRQGYVDRNEIIQRLKAEGRSQEIQTELQKLKSKNEPVPDGLAYITGEVKDDYLHDMYIAQDYARLNRETIAYLILQELGLNSCIAANGFHTVHNYIDTNDNGTILRKGAVRANMGEMLIIPMNMRDGSLICIGKGNPDWNYSAPHGAGRLMSRKKAKESLSLEEFADNMKDVYSSSVCAFTLDEAPMAYKPMQSIVDAIQETVDIQNIIRPIYNFKAKE